MSTILDQFCVEYRKRRNLPSFAKSHYCVNPTAVVVIIFGHSVFLEQIYNLSCCRKVSPRFSVMPSPAVFLFFILFSTLSCQTPISVYLSPSAARFGAKGLKCYKNDVASQNHMTKIFCPRQKRKGFCMKKTLEYQDGRVAIVRDCSSDAGGKMKKGCFNLASKAPVRKTFACFCQRKYCNSQGRLVTGGLIWMATLLSALTACVPFRM